MSDTAKPVYYIVGPRAMVDSMENILIGLKVNPEKIKLERFG